jgi:hypothetical protein
MFSPFHLPLFSWENTDISHLARRGVPSINKQCNQATRRHSWIKKFTLWCSSQELSDLLPIVLASFFLGLWEISLRSPNSCSRLSGLLCGLVPVCGSAIVRRSSRDRHGFGVSLPVAWSHPTLAGIKLVIPAIFFQLSFVRTYCREDRATHGFVPIIWYQISGYHGRFHPHTIHSFIVVSCSPFCVLRSAPIVHKIAKKKPKTFV